MLIDRAPICRAGHRVERSCRTAATARVEWEIPDPRHGLARHVLLNQQIRPCHRDRPRATRGLHEHPHYWSRHQAAAEHVSASSTLGCAGAGCAARPTGSGRRRAVAGDQSSTCASEPRQPASGGSTRRCQGWCTPRASLFLAPSLAGDSREHEDCATTLVKEHPEDKARIREGVTTLRRRELLPGWYDDGVILERERLCQLRLHTLKHTARRQLERRDIETALHLALEAVLTEPRRQTATALLISVYLAERMRPTRSTNKTRTPITCGESWSSSHRRSSTSWCRRDRGATAGDARVSTAGPQRAR